MKGYNQINYATAAALYHRRDYTPRTRCQLVMGGVLTGGIAQFKSYCNHRLKRILFEVQVAIPADNNPQVIHKEIESQTLGIHERYPLIDVIRRA